MKYDSEHMRNYVMNFWNTSMGKTMAEQAQAVQQVVGQTAQQVMPAVEELKANMKKLEEENMAYLKDAAEQMQNNPLRKEIQSEVEQVKQGLMQGFMTLQQTMMEAKRQVKNAKREY